LIKTKNCSKVTNTSSGFLINLFATIPFTDASCNTLARKQMNSLPGLLIEYFINGVIALIWIAFAFFPEAVHVDNTTALILIPVVYVLGMFIDVIAYLVTLYPKRRIRKTIEKERNFSTGEQADIKLRIAATYPHLSKELANRSSRDRICRGMLINSLGITALPQVQVGFGIGLVIVSFLMWIIFERQSHNYFISACIVIANLPREESVRAD